MVIAGEASGDGLAAELVLALREHPQVKAQPWPIDFFGAGGPRLAAVGVSLHCDMTAHSVVGLLEVVRKYREFKRLFGELLQLAFDNLPDLIILVDFAGFNRRFAAALRRRLRSPVQPFHNWEPKLVYYVSPQVWASRPGRARTLARDLDLLLSIFPFEKEWYARATPELRVEFIGHPLLDRYPRVWVNQRVAVASQIDNRPPAALHDHGVLLPGSRPGELRQHLPPMLEAVRILQSKTALKWHMILPTPALLEIAANQVSQSGLPIQCSVGNLAETLAGARVAIASTGTVTLELAFFRVPTVAIYKTSWTTFQIGKRIIQVPFLAMPNLLANKPIFPELIQDEATGEKIARAALPIILDEALQKRIRTKLDEVIASLGEPGACARGALDIVSLFLEK